MRICKYCKKPISDDDQVWNPDGEGNGYHHSCLCEMEFMSRDRQIYDKGRTDVLDKIRAEIVDTLYVDSLIFGELIDFRNGKMSADDVIEEFNRITRMEVLKILDKYKAESEG
jgi:hypothetical protein